MTSNAMRSWASRHLMVNLQDETQARTLERMQHFADRIMPLTA
jgi:hypothetical protein